MKNFLNKYGAILLVTVLLIALPLSSAHAENWFGLTIGDAVETLLAWVINVLISWMSIMVAMAGWLLNFSMNLTLNIKSFVDSTPAIYTTWRTIRDISGLFMIFFLLYAAFQLILGMKRPNFDGLIKNIVIAGILINFSFFFAGLGIDASNIISVQLYNAIAPQNNLNPAAATTSILGGTWRSSVDGGISDIFMKHLKIQSIYNTKLADPAAAGSAATAGTGAGSAIGSAISGPVKIIIMGAVALIIEFAAAMSFGAAAIAFIFRFVVLILLLAFSPIWMLGFLSPEVKEYAKKWSDHYMSMLIFMPVYLLLMYVALSVLTTSPIFNDGSGALVSAATNIGNSAWYSSFIVLGVNAAIVIVLLNMPLAAAASIAGGTIGFLKTAQKNFSVGTLFSKAGSQAGSRTLGRAAYALNNSTAVAKIAGASPIAGSLITNGLSSVSKASFGEKKGDYESRLKTKKKAEEDLHKQIGTLDETKYKNKEDLDAAKAARRQAQANYRSNLPWTAGILNPGLPGTSGIVGFMMDNRANRQTAAKLNKQAEKDAKKEKKKEAEKANKEDNAKIKANDRRIEDIDTELENHTFTDGSTDNALRDEKRDLLAKNKALRENIESRKEDIEAGKAIEEEEKESKRDEKINEAAENAKKAAEKE